MPDDDPAERRRQHDRRAQRVGPRGDGTPQQLRVRGILEHEGALKIPRAVQTRRQTEVSLEQRARAAE